MALRVGLHMLPVEESVELVEFTESVDVEAPESKRGVMEFRHDPGLKRPYMFSRSATVIQSLLWTKSAYEDADEIPDRTHDNFKSNVIFS